MTQATEERAVGRGEMARMGGVGVLVGGLGAVVVALVVSAASAGSVGLPSWVWVMAVALIVAGVGAVSARLWAVGLGLGAVLLGRWAVLATVTDVESGLPGPAIPLLAAGCAAVLVAAVLLAVPPAAPWRRGSVVRQALPAAIGLVMVAVFAGVTEVAALRWIPVDATTADRVDPAPVPDQPARVRWTWPTPHPLRGVVAAGAGVVVAYDDRVVALDGPTGAERWHHRWVGADVLDLAATPDGRIAVARVRAGGSRPQSAVFAFDADTGEVRWSRQPGFRFLGATDHVLVRIEDDGTHVGADLGDGDDIWSWKPQADCEPHWSRTSPDAMLSAQTCRDPAGNTSYGVVGFDDRSGAQRWRFASATTVVPVEYKPFLETSPDGRVAMFAFSNRSGNTRSRCCWSRRPARWCTGRTATRTSSDPTCTLLCCDARFPTPSPAC